MKLLIQLAEVWGSRGSYQLRSLVLQRTLAVACVLLPLLSAAQISTNGSETIVNTTTANSQQSTDVAADTSGNYVVVWESENQDGDGWGIYMQRYNSSRVAQGSETLVNTTTSGDQRYPAVAMNNIGDFAVTWMSYDQDGDGWGIYHQRYDDGGVAQGSETQTNSTTTGEQKFPDIAMRRNGRYCIVWQDVNTSGHGTIYARSYNSSGSASSAVQIDTTTSVYSAHPAIATAKDNGNFLAVWQREGSDGDGNGIIAHQLGSTGSLSGSEIIANTTTAGNQEAPDVAVDSDNNAMIVWTNHDGDGDGAGIYGQRFTSFTTPEGSEFLVNPSTTGAQLFPSIDVNLTGYFAVSWDDYSLDGSYSGIYLTSYDSLGIRLDDEIKKINASTTNFQQHSAVAMGNRAKDAIVAWQDGQRDSPGTDGDDYGVFHRGVNIGRVLRLSLDSDSVSCNGLTDGMAIATVTGGYTNYTYAWSTGASTSSISAGAGTYALTVTDKKGYTVVDSVIVPEPDGMTITVSTSTNVSCNAAADGSVLAAATGGTSPYSYAWSSGGSSSAEVSLSGGTYTATITDANGCQVQDSTTVTEPAVLTQGITQDAPVLCNGDANGMLTAAAAGGTTPYSYLWSNAATTASISSLAAGTYTATVTDANGCTATTSSAVAEPTLLTVTVSTTANVDCAGASNGSASATPAGGTTPYTYAWSSGASTAAPTGLAGGSHVVTVTDANGCSVIDSTTITEPSTLTASIVPNASPACNGASTGQLTGVASNGTTPYSFSWSNGGSSATIFNLLAGTYTVTVTDANGCTATNNRTVTEPAAIVVNLSETTAITCNGGNDGEATSSPSGGTTPYSYNWSTGGSTSSISGLSAATYTVTVTDAGGCTVAEFIVIENPPGLVVSIIESGSIACASGTDGELTAFANVGTSPYTYLWSNTGTASIISGLAAGTYTCSVTDANGCTGTASETLAEPAALTASTAVTTAVSCNGLADGSASASATGGTTAYTYQWSNTATSENITGVAAGTYTVTITDANGCTASSSVAITEPTALAANAATSSNASCNGATDGSATGTPSGGTTPYTYLWSTSATTASISGVGAGTYTLTVTDANGCTAVDSASVTEPTTVTASVSTGDETCGGNSDGTASVTPGGGTTPYGYAWSTGATTASLNSLAAGTYTATVTDANGCTATASGTVSAPATVTAVASTTGNVTCNGDSDGSVDAVATGGTTPYTYLWSTGASTTTISGLAGGTYTVTATDNNGCTASSSTSVTEPAVVTASVAVDNNVSCNGAADGGLTVTPGGGTTPFTYLWSNAGTTASITGLSAGTYTATVTDANGCTATGSASVTEPAALSVSATTNSNASCNGATDGSATGTPSGGTTPYTYLWSTSATTASLSGVGAGTYTLTVTDAGGCAATDSTSISQPAAVTASVNTGDATCSGISDGTASVTAGGGTTPYGYAWSTGATTASLTGLAAGTYTATVTDANGCTATASGTVSAPAAVTALASTTGNVTCNGDSDGSADAVATGGTSPFTYLWSTGASTTTISSLSAGTYTVTATDNNGCTSSSSTTVTEPTAVTASVAVDNNVSCNGAADGGLTVTPGGGTTPFTYLWSNAGTTAAITGLSAGTYTATVTDANGCTATGSASVTEPAALSVSATTNSNASCNGATDGSATGTPSGGTTPYTYLWSTSATTASLSGVGAGTYTLTVTDASGCTATDSTSISQPTAVTASVNTGDATCSGISDGTASVTAGGGTTPYLYAWSSGATTASLTGLAAGTYTATVTDANGCTATASGTVSAPAAVTALASTTGNVTCNGDSDGSADAVATGGTTPFTYLWSTGASTTTISSLSAGTYTVTATDNNGCTSSSSTTVTEPTAVTASVAVDNNVSCNGAADGGLTVTPGGGTTPYTYLWSNAGTTASITGLSAGTYTATVTDANGCTATGSASITEPAALSVSATTNSNASCNGATDGSATGTPSGGTTPYTYLWSTSATTASLSGVGAGTYTLTVTDASGCTATDSTSISQPAAVTASVNTGDATCSGISDGTASVTAGGGTTPYGYAWSTGATTASLTGLAAGTYTATVTDANGCTATASGTVSAPAAVTALASTTGNVTCNGDSDGSADAVATGGTTPFTYLWSTGASSTTIAGLAGGTYTVTATDNNGCTSSSSTTVTEPTAVTANVTVDNNVTCNGAADGGLSTTPTGGSTPYTYLWSNGGSAASITGLSAGTYTATVTDANGCTATGSASITEPTALSLSATTNSNASCNGATNGLATGTASGGTTPYTYLWSTGATTASISSIGAGTYTLTVTDASNCTVVDSTTVTEPAAVTASVNTGDATCSGISDGTASVTAGGGTTPYMYAWSTGATTASLTGLAAGTYTATVTDASGCTATASGTVSAPAAVTALASTTGNVTCNGDSDGSADAVATGGTSPYTYLWSTGASTTTISGLAGGTYTVTATDNNGCTGSSSTTVTEPTAVTASVAVDNNASCNGAADGGLTTTPGGGTSPYTYVWSNGGSVAAANTGLAAGTYTVTVTDANGCTGTGSASITEPTALTVAVSITGNASCNGATDGSASGTASGGTSPYTYQWSNGGSAALLSSVGAGTYTLTVTDANSCTVVDSATVTEPIAVTALVATGDATCAGNNDGTANVTAGGGTTPYVYMWSTGATTAGLTGLAAGTYTATVTDANGCTATASGTVTAPPAVTALASTTGNATCNGGSNGSADAVATGGTSPYTYLWSNAATSTTISGLAAGTYTVTATDSNGCTGSSSTTVTEPTAITASVTVDNDASCNGAADGGLTASAGGGTSPYTFAWSTGGSTASVTGLAAGTYTVTVTDANGCTNSSTGSISEPTALTAAAVTVTEVSCNGGSDGDVTVTGSGGTPGYTFLWSTGGTGASVGTLSAGTYTVTLTDANGCTATDSTTVTEPTAVSASVGPGTDATCAGASDGSLQALATGGTTPYVYNWSNGASGNPANSLTAGTYTVTVTDANGCTATSSGTVSEPVALIVTASTLSNPVCNGGNGGSVDAVVSGGTSAYTYLWSNGTTLSSSTGITAGTYTVTVTDANGCTATSSSVVTDPAAITATATATDIACNGESNGTAGVSVGNGTSPYTYLWSNGAATASIINLTAGTYTATVTDANGCSATGSTTVNEPAALDPGLSVTNISCNGNADGSLVTVASGGTNPYTYLWSTGAVSSALIGLAPGTYTLTLSDGAGCDTVVASTLSDPAVLTVSIGSLVPASCQTEADGQMTATAAGGTTPYSYLWSNGETTATGTLFEGQDYTVTVTDAGGCTADAFDTPGYECPTPVDLKEYNIQDTTVRLGWLKVCGATAYKIRIKIAGQSAPWDVHLTSGPVAAFIIDTLTANKTYRWTVQAKCDKVWGPISVESKFTTIGFSCNTPVTVFTSPVGATKARLNWSAAPNAVKYRLRWREVGTSSWTVLVKTAPVVRHWLSGLTPATSYEWQVRTICAVGPVSGTAWSPMTTFTTGVTAKFGDDIFVLSGDDASGMMDVFPNPSFGQFNVVFDLGTSEEAQLEVVSSLGKLVYVQRVNGSEQAVNHRVELPRIAAGVYYVRIRSADVLLTRRIVVQ